MGGLIALAAVVLTSIQLLPQTYEAIKKHDVSHLSTGTHLMIAISTLLWIIHGSNIRDSAIIFANIVMFACAVTVLYMKMKKQSSGAGGSSGSSISRGSKRPAMRVRKRR